MKMAAICRKRNCTDVQSRCTTGAPHPDSPDVIGAPSAGFCLSTSFLQYPEKELHKWTLKGRYPVSDSHYPTSDSDFGPWGPLAPPASVPSFLVPWHRTASAASGDALYKTRFAPRVPLRSTSSFYSINFIDDAIKGPYRPRSGHY